MRTRLALGMACVTVWAVLALMGAGAAFAGGLKGGTGLHTQSKKWLPWYESGGFLSSEEHRTESNLFVPI